MVPTGWERNNSVQGDWFFRPITAEARRWWGDAPGNAWDNTWEFAWLKAESSPPRLLNTVIAVQTELVKAAILSLPEQGSELDVNCRAGRGERPLSQAPSFLFKIEMLM